MTDFIEISNDYRSGYYVEGDPDDPYSSGSIAGTGKILAEVTGDLAARVQARAGRLGKVTILENHWDLGYCVTCSSEVVNFVVYVDDEEVWKTGAYGEFGVDTMRDLTGYAQFNEWLNEDREAQDG